MHCGIADTGWCGSGRGSEIATTSLVVPLGPFGRCDSFGMTTKKNGEGRAGCCESKSRSLPAESSETQTPRTAIREERGAIKEKGARLPDTRHRDAESAKRQPSRRRFRDAGTALRRQKQRMPGFPVEGTGTQRARKDPALHLSLRGEAG